MRTLGRARMLNLLFGGGGAAPDPGAAFGEVVLSLNPYAYWPMDDASGPTVRDATGNGNTGTYNGAGITYQQDGQKGKAVDFANADVDYKVLLSSALNTTIDPRNYSMVFLTKVTHQAPEANPKLLELWNAAGEYSAYEIRIIDGLTAFLNEGSVQQNVTPTIFGKIENDTWVLIVLFNSEITGNCGMYYNTDYRPFERILGGITPPTGAVGTGAFAFYDGLVQHVAFFDHELSQAEVNALYNAAFLPPAWTLSYLFADDFANAESAPITAPRTAAPGPGQWTVTDTGNKYSLSAGAIRWSTKTVDSADPRLISSSPISILPGRTFAAKVTPGALTVGWSSSAAIPQASALWFQGGIMYAENGSPQLEDVAAGQEYSIINIQHNPGRSHWFIKGGVYTQWTLVWLGEIGNSYYAGFGVQNAGAVTNVSQMRVCDLPTPFYYQTGVASVALQGKRSAGDTFVHEANCWLTFKIVTLPSAGTLIDLRFRKVDADNYWQITVDSTGALTLNEVVAGVSTQRATKAAGSIAGKHNFIVMRGTTIQAFYNPANWTRAWTYTSATNFATATTGVLVSKGTGGRVSDIIVYPRVLSATPAAILDQIVA